MPCTCPVLGTATPEFDRFAQCQPNLRAHPPLPDQKLRLGINMFPLEGRPHFFHEGWGRQASETEGRPHVFQEGSFRRILGSPALRPHALPEFGGGES